MFSTMRVGLTYKHQARVVVLDSDKHLNKLRYGINYDRKKVIFYNVIELFTAII
jgi:hypothetical protein